MLSKISQSALSTPSTAMAVGSPSRTGRLRLRLLSICGLTAVLAGLMVGLTGTANAATSPSLVNGSPYFGCTRTTTGGYIGTSALQLVRDNRTVTVGAEVYRFNGSGWSDYGSMYTASNTTVYSFTNSVFGNIPQNTLHAYVGHGYYKVVFIWANPGSSVGAALAADGSYARGYTDAAYYSTYICSV